MDKLESLRQVLLQVKYVYKFSIPSARFKAKSEFQVFNTEIVKTILGRLCTILIDKKDRRYNAISFDILISDILKLKKFSDNQCLTDYQERLKKIEEKYKDFRNKMYAHVELGCDNHLRKIDELEVSASDILELLRFGEDVYDNLFKLLDPKHYGFSNFNEGDLERISDKVWRAYESTGLVTRIR